MGKRWTGGFFVDQTWRYSDHAMTRIAEAIGAYRAERVNYQAQVYRSMRENEQAKPRPAAVKKQIVALGEACSRLLDALDLDMNVVDEIESSEIRRRIAADVTELRNQAWAAEHAFSGRGRPTEESRRYFLNRLKDIWTDANGQPGRAVVGKHETGPFADFVRDCVGELPGFEHGLDDLIREVADRQKK